MEAREEDEQAASPVPSFSSSSDFESDTEEPIIPLLMDHPAPPRLVSRENNQLPGPDDPWEVEEGEFVEEVEEMACPVRYGDVVELYDENKEVALSAGQWSRSLCLPQAHYYPTLQKQGPVGWGLGLPQGGLSSAVLQYGSVVTLRSLSQDQSDFSQLRAWRTAFVHLSRFDATFDTCYQWRVLPAHPAPTKSCSVRYGDIVLLLNVYYRQFLCAGDTDSSSGFLSTVKDRSRACGFTLRPHVPLPARRLAQLEQEKQQLEMVARQSQEIHQQLRDFKVSFGVKQQEAERLKEEKERLSEKKRLLDAEVDHLYEQRTCIICFDRQRNVRFDPCGHVCCCDACSEDLQDCPVDRRPITLKQPVYAYV
eukprot:gb/GEZN01007381.1/.p1 GENE.gb/GEZN01007381.1/~~gb/GEZN01007381.1/.p1  ORF type:complete len:384 (-),score=48.75 gb/GEZN01007381.1/:393-1490(-)